MPLQEVDPITGLPLSGDPQFTGAPVPQLDIETGTTPDIKAQIAKLMQLLAAKDEQIKKLISDHDALAQKHSDLIAQNAVLSQGVAATLPPIPAIHPPIGTSVTFVNHAGVHESAQITGHGHRGVSLDIQGKHPNDKYKRQEIPAGGPAQPLSYFKHS
jgi:hypothetical protein